MNGKTNNENIEMMIKAAYHITHTSFWNSWSLSKYERDGTKQFIRKFITLSNDPYFAYVEYCQRVLLAREYICKNPEKYVPAPSKWFNKYNQMGFIGTGRWYRSMIDIRRSFPLYRQQFKALPEAILEMIEEPTAVNFHYWRQWFIERNQQATANLYMSIIANIIFY